MSEAHTQVIGGPYWTRRKARKLERIVQSALDAGGGYRGGKAAPDTQIAGLWVPTWARGVRVERMGTRHFSAAMGRVTWCLVATTRRGS